MHDLIQMTLGDKYIIMMTYRDFFLKDPRCRPVCFHTDPRDLKEPGRHLFEIREGYPQAGRMPGPEPTPDLEQG